MNPRMRIPLPPLPRRLDGRRQRAAAPGRVDSRALPPRRGASRAGGLAVSLLAVIGAGAGVIERACADSSPDLRAEVRITRQVRLDHVAASLEQAYEAFRSGDSGTAERAYRAVIGHEPGNRDALLGLAALAGRAGRWDEAAGHYAQVLVFHPADTVARAALIAIDERDPVRGESRLKELLRSEPRSAYLHFNLGNAYAAQSRWPEAQQAYLNAYRLDSGTADHAYNLAVSLDHLARRGSALDFYRAALALSQSAPASFNPAAVRMRIGELGAGRDAGFPTVRPSPEPSGAATAAAGAR